MAKKGLRFVVIMGILGMCTVPLAAAAAPPAPPTAAAIYEELERLWKEGDVDAFAGYVDGLKRDYPGYVPTRLASILMDAIDGAPEEKTAADLGALGEELDPLLPWVSPDFEADIKTVANYYDGFAKALEEKGIKRDGTLRRPKVLQGPFLHFNLTSLFYFAPEIVLPFEGGTRRGPLKLGPVEGDANDIDYEEALAILRSPAEEPQSRQRAALAVLGASQDPEAIENLCAVITGSGANFVASARAAEAVSGLGEAAVPALLDALQQPELFSDEKKRIIWALVRTGVRRPDVRDAVKQEVEKLFLLRAYVERALPYL